MNDQAKTRSTSGLKLDTHASRQQHIPSHSGKPLDFAENLQTGVYQRTGYESVVWLASHRLV